MTKRLLMILALFTLVLAACQAADTGASAPASDQASASAAESIGPVAVDVTGANVDAIIESGTLRCGVKFDVRAFGFKNPETDEIEGLDADLCRAIAESMGVEPEFIEAVSANRIPFLQEDTVDVVISTMTVNEERKLEIDFSHVYFVAGQSLLVKDGSDIKSIDDLAAKVVCSVEGSTSEENIREMAPEAELLLFKTYTEAGQALADGRCEAVSTDNTILFGLAEQFEGTGLVGDEFTEEPLGIGIKKDREDLVAYVDAVLEGLKENGGLKALYQKWIEPFTGEVPEPPF
jgi:putative glutamine transport system substrate-binding protein